MSDELDTAKQYRQRAEELRAIAAEDRTKANRLALEKIADDYESMADTLEAIHKTNEATYRSRPK
jgi:molecular chaperone GrpE (heat shock protein)